MSSCNATTLSALESSGLTISTAASFLSISADFVTWAVIARIVINNYGRPGWRLVKTPIDAYILCLIFSDTIEAFGELLSVKWIHDGQVTCSSFCTAQGILEVLGETSSAMTTLAIAVFTFLRIGFHMGIRMRSTVFVIALIWLYVILFTSIASGIHSNKAVRPNNTSDEFDVPSPYWCWINSKFLGDQIAAEYIWLWISAFASVILYLPLFFIARGTLDYDPHAPLKIRFGANGQAHESSGVPFRILLYPIAYTTLVLPLSVVRFIDFTHPTLSKRHSGAATFGCTALYQLTGFVNVILLFYTRRGIGLFDNDSSDDEEVVMPERVPNGHVEDPPAEPVRHRHRMDDYDVEPFPAPRIPQEAGLPD